MDVVDAALSERLERYVKAWQAKQPKGAPESPLLRPYPRRTLIGHCRAHIVDPLFVASIMGAESGFGTRGPGVAKRNGFGIMARGELRTFKGWDEGFAYVARLLRIHYLDHGLTTIRAIAGKYAPSIPSHPDQPEYWTGLVSSLYVEMDGYCMRQR
jgi:hypothetical protein